MVYDGRLGVGASTVGIAFDLRSFAGNSAITFNGVNVGSLTSIEALIFRGTNVNDTVGGGWLARQPHRRRRRRRPRRLVRQRPARWRARQRYPDRRRGPGHGDLRQFDSRGERRPADLGVAQNTGGARHRYAERHRISDRVGLRRHPAGRRRFQPDHRHRGGAGATALSQTDSLFGYGGNDSMLVTRGTPAAAVATNINMDGGDGDDLIELRGGTLSVALAANAAGLSALGTRGPTSPIWSRARPPTIATSMS